jgi:hypothetical protein
MNIPISPHSEQLLREQLERGPFTLPKRSSSTHQKRSLKKGNTVQ